MSITTLPSDEEGWAAPIPDAVDLVVEADAMMSMFAAHRYQRIEGLRRDALADAGHAELAGLVERSVRLELAAALGITEAVAGMLLAEAEALVNRYPAVLEALASARVTPRHATLLVETLDAVDLAFRAQLVQPALELAETLPVGTFRRKLRALVETVRGATLTERYENALTQRRVVVEIVDDAMGWLHLYAPAVEVRAIHTRLTAQAKALQKRSVDARSLDQLRADIAGDVLIDGDTALLPPQARGIRATVTVTVPVLALLDGDTTRHGLASVEGVGPIPIEQARILCGSSKQWMRVLTHPETGIVLSVGRDSYRPPAALRRLVRWRSETCMAPGCVIPASRCQIDHSVAWESGGLTALGNLGPLCGGHHTVKHHTQWSLEQLYDSGGTMRWTSPSGRVYLVQPERRTPSFTAPATAKSGDPPPF